jgi:hypothetical protein
MSRRAQYPSTNRVRVMGRFFAGLHSHDHAESRKWNQHNPSTPRPRPPGEGKRKNRKAQRAVRQKQQKKLAALRKAVREYEQREGDDRAV